MEQLPSVGRIVHYTSHHISKGGATPDHYAAVITKVPKDIEQDKRCLELAGGVYHYPVSLCVMYDGIMFKENVEFKDDMTQPNGWHWPERA